MTRLESRLGVQLLRRTTRRLSRTDAGRLYLEQTRLAFTQIEEAERAIRGQEGELSGRVRKRTDYLWASPSATAAQRICPQYPAVQVELSIANRNVDLIAEGV